jgi:hypothetical protein
MKSIGAVYLQTIGDAGGGWPRIVTALVSVFVLALAAEKLSQRSLGPAEMTVGGGTA